ncbi:hypothetical protein JGS39_18155 [Streptomyces sp. P01-B04]|uniref:DUF7848 domain-containing protein n=1 Tax=Streptomyces poriferorum TaxID=2798799 RepID=UPI001C5DB7A4|nr:hypothetical protein [Streptomyces poriferorum]MBW5250891.1 hypothetical protein [Streptomyces poriferorum]MBW5256564.1 hypothetical protein [Streptomyces poriferorum]
MSSVRSVVRHVPWTIAPDREPDGEPITYVLQCVVCRERSERSEHWKTPQKWALRHSGKNPTHHTFREVIWRPWRTHMNDEPGARS